MTTIRNETTIRRAPNDVYDFVTTPANWPRWHPSSLAVSGDDATHSLELGDRCVEEYVVAGRRGRAEWVCRERVTGRTWTIEGAPEGGGRGTIRYDVAPADDGTRFVRTLRYEMPNALLALLDALVIRRRVAAESAEALARLRTLLEAPIPAEPPSTPAVEAMPSATRSGRD